MFQASTSTGSVYCYDTKKEKLLWNLKAHTDAITGKLKLSLFYLKIYIYY